MDAELFTYIPIATFFLVTFSETAQVPWSPLDACTVFHFFTSELLTKRTDPPLTSLHIRALS